MAGIRKRAFKPRRARVRCPHMSKSSRNRSEAAKLAHMRRRILARYAEATAADLASGLDWYARAFEGARALLPNDPTRAAGVIAALSPRCHWRTNLVWAASVIEAAETGSECPAVHMRAMRAQAWRIANGEHPLDVLNGPKVRAFFANITGDLERVTVDVWAARAAEGDTVPKDRHGVDIAPSGRRYALLERAYQEAAKVLDISPRACQAAVWVHVRGAAD